MEDLKLKYDEIYKKGNEKFHTFPLNDIYQAMFDFMKDVSQEKDILDLGCGNGDFIIDYLSKISLDIIGIDFSEIAIQKAIERGKIFTFINCDFNNIDKKLSKNLGFDVIVSIGVIEHLDDPTLIFQIAEDRLCPGGYLFLNHPNFLNLRGIIWRALELFCEAEMSLTDKHIILPEQIFDWAKNYGFKIEKVKTIRQSAGMYKDLLKDFDKRLRKALVHIPDYNEKIDVFLSHFSMIANKKLIQGSDLTGSEIFWKLKKI